MPHVHPLPTDFSLPAAFATLAEFPGCLWLDSVSPGPVAADASPIGRYSFLCADPVATLQVSAGQPDPWPALRRWADRLPQGYRNDLPPFQGGLAGLWGYEAGDWLEPMPAPADDDLPTPALSVGLYDWVICQDRLVGKSWLISQGFVDESLATDETLARRRCDQVRRWLATAPDRAPSITAPDVAQVAPRVSTARADIWSNFTSGDYRAAVDAIVNGICRGDCFQVNLAQRLVTPARCDSPSLYRRLRRANPAPMAGYYNGGDFQVLSSSPECFLRIRDGWVETRPIKGTAACTGDQLVDAAVAERLRASDKDRAENVMIVDLMRNDLSRVCDDASVEVPQLCAVERYAYVQHLVSVVRGRLRPGVNPIDALAACFPGGSITGAPKIEAMRTIRHLEPNRRGPYCGSLGYVSTGGRAEFNILIRTLTACGGWWQIPAGGGITAASQNEAEEGETWVKAEGLLRAIFPD